MVIKRIKIKNFGKISDRTLELSPGMNVLYGENESGKTTVHTFIKSMFYGIARQRGKAAKNDAYTTYEPWENPVVYGGTLWFESAGKQFRLTRNFHKTNLSGELLCESDGELLDVAGGDLEQLLGEVSEAVYENTVSVGQLKSVTGPSLVRELQNYMASYRGAGDHSVDLGRTMQMLKMSRKGFQVQEERRKRGIQKEQEKLTVKMSYLRRELDEAREQQSQIEERQKSLGVGGTEREQEPSGEALLDEQIAEVKRRKLVWGLGILGSALFCAGLGVAMLVRQAYFPWGLVALIMTAALFLCGAELQRRLEIELRRRKKLKARWISRRDKLQWSRENLEETLGEKETAFANLTAEYQEYDRESRLPSEEQLEIQALNMALETIETLSGNINRNVGERLRRRTSRILGEITGGKYQEVLMDEQLRMSVNTQERIVPLERLSRGTLEQIYFALRMAAGELLCGGERFPVILDDVFGMYDEERLAAVLNWLYKEERQVIISTCHKREMEVLEKEGIPYRKEIL